MGIKMAPSFANLFLGIFGTIVFSNALFHPRTWWRYLDDIFMIWTEELDQWKIFVDYLNNHSTIKLASNHLLTNVPLLDVIRLRVFPLSLGPSIERAAKETRERKNGRARRSRAAIFLVGFFASRSTGKAKEGLPVVYYVMVSLNNCTIETDQTCRQTPTPR